MRILRIDEWNGAPGGGQEYVRSVSDELAARGHENLLINLVDAPPTHPRADERYVRIHSPGVGRALPDIGRTRAFESLFEESMRSFRPDLVHLHHFAGSFGSIARVVSRLEVPLLFTAHDAELVCPISTLVKPGAVICDGGIRPRCLFTGCPVGLGGPLSIYRARRFERMVAPRVRVYLCPSELLAKYLDSNGFRPAVHLPSFARIPAQVEAAPYPPPPPEVPPTVGFLGRLEWYKGVDDLIDAVALLAGSRPEVRLEIAGEGSERAALEARARAVGIGERTKFLGDLRGPEKERWFRGIHVLAVPSSQWENFGLVALEGQVRGRPVVATNFGGLPDIVVDGVTGRLVPLSDPPALAAALDQILEDPVAAARLGEEGRSRVLGRFTPKLHVDRLLAVYERVLAGGSFESLSKAAALLAPTVESSGP